jgi:hypothetical protein
MGALQQLSSAEILEQARNLVITHIMVSVAVELGRDPRAGANPNPNPYPNSNSIPNPDTLTLTP